MNLEQFRPWIEPVATGTTVVVILAVVRSTWRSLGPLRSLVRFNRGFASHRVIVRDGDDQKVLSSTFTARRVVWERARLRGPDPNTGEERILWERVRHLPCKLRDGDLYETLSWDELVVVVPRVERRAALHVLAHEIPSVTRRIARGGYHRAPEMGTIFQLEEEIVTEGQAVRIVPGWSSGERAILTSYDNPRLFLRAGRSSLVGMLMTLVLALQWLLVQWSSRL